MKETGCYDVAVIGGGVVGSAIARELSRYHLRTALLEKEADIAEGISKANSGVLHAGFNVPPGSLKARFNIEGLSFFPELAEELDVPSRRSTKLVVAKDDEERRVLERLIEQGRENGAGGLSIVGADMVSRIAPGVEGKWALYSEHTGIINPFLFTIALAEVALHNGVDIYLQSEVDSVVKLPRDRENETRDTSRGGNGGKSDARYLLRTVGGKEFRASLVINAAGLGSERIARMVEPDFPERIYPCRGEYHIVDKHYAETLDVAVYPVPVKDGRGLGVHLTPTTNGNILFGPSAEYIDSPEDTATTADTMRRLLEEAFELFPPLRGAEIIRSYAGIRPKLFTPESGIGFKDFYIREAKTAPGFLNLVGIESPGLTASPAIARYVVADFVTSYLRLEEKEEFEPKRRGVPRIDQLSSREKEALISENSEFAEIFCRCEGISKAEIRHAAENPLKVRTLNGIKKRSYSMMGRCQGGFCLPRISRFLIEECGLAPEELCIAGPGSELLKERLD